MRGLRFYQQFFSFLGASGIGALIFFDKRSIPEDQRDERGGVFALVASRFASNFNNSGNAQNPIMSPDRLCSYEYALFFAYESPDSLAYAPQPLGCPLYPLLFLASLANSPLDLLRPSISYLRPLPRLELLEISYSGMTTRLRPLDSPPLRVFPWIFFFLAPKCSPYRRSSLDYE